MTCVNDCKHHADMFQDHRAGPQADAGVVGAFPQKEEQVGNIFRMRRAFLLPAVRSGSRVVVHGPRGAREAANPEKSRPRAI